MIADLRPYMEYKESGFPWLGLMPAHWGLPRLGSVLRERGETNEQKQVTQVLSVLKDVGVIRYEDKGNIGNKKSEDIRRYKIVRVDDIVVNCMNVIIGSVGRSRHVGCLSPVYYVLTRRSEAEDPRYLAAVFSAKPFQLSLVRIGNGILSHRMRIPMELLKCEPFPVPPPEEQAAIARFLDWANGRLERAIRAKRKVIALLNEQKQAITHRAVTRGLNHSVALKPSGIPWLGDIPQHWGIRRLRTLVHRIDQGVSPLAVGFLADGNSWGVLKSGCVDRGIFRETEHKQLARSFEIDPSFVVKVGDVLISRACGSPTLVGSVGRVIPDFLFEV
jgi:type I restriction enzyme S subunit